MNRGLSYDANTHEVGDGNDVNVPDPLKSRTPLGSGQWVLRSGQPSSVGPTSRRYETPSPETGEGGQRPGAAWAAPP